MSDRPQYGINDDITITVQFFDKDDPTTGLTGLSPTVTILKPDDTLIVLTSNVLNESANLDGAYGLVIPNSVFSQFGIFQTRVYSNSAQASPQIAIGSFVRIRSAETTQSVSGLYTTRTAVKRLLRAIPDGTVDFSENVTQFISNLDGFYLANVTPADSFAGKNRKITLTFTDSTSFTGVLRQKRTGSANIQLGSGTTKASFTDGGGRFTINPSDWVGSGSTIGTEIKFTLDSHMSNDDLDQFILDSEAWIDGLIQAELLDEFPTGKVKLFDPAPIPKIILFAATRLAAYYVYTSLNPTNLIGGTSSDEAPNEVDTWFRQGRRLINSYIAFKNIRKEAAPRIMGHKPIFMRVGVDGIGENMLNEINFDNAAINAIINSPELQFDERTIDIFDLDKF